MTFVEEISLSVIQGPDTYNIADYATLFGVQGAGMPPMHRLKKRGPLQHGSTDRGYRLDPRVLRLLFYFTRGNANGFFTNREMMSRIFAPSIDEMILRFDLGNGARRNIVGSVAGGLEMDTDPSRPGYQALVVDVECGSPTFYNPVVQSITFSVSYSENTFQVPMEVPLYVGTSELDSQETIDYQGTWRSYPHRIRIEGQIENPVITNLSTNEVLDFTGITIADGNYYDLDLRYNYKTVVDSNGDSKISDLTKDSDLATWHIGSPPEVAKGQNTIAVEGTNVNSNTKLQISWYDRYLGF